MRQTWSPARVVALADSRAETEFLPLLQNRPATEPAMAYVCRNYACKDPVSSPAELRAALVLEE